MLVFYVAYPSIHIFIVVYPALFIDLKHPIFAESRYPRFIRNIATPPNHIFFRIAYRMLFWSRLPTFWSLKLTLP